MTIETKAGARSAYIEALRIVAAFGIVWFHAKLEYRYVAYAALPAFAALSLYLDARRPDHAAIAGASLALRLLLPWLFWYGVYLLANLALGRPPLIRATNPPLSFLAGPAIHLWYLPFLFAVILLRRVASRVVPGRAVNAAVAIAVVLYLAWAIRGRFDITSLGPPLSQHLYILPALAFGLLMASAEAFRVEAIAVMVALATATLLGMFDFVLGAAALAIAVLLGRYKPLAVGAPIAQFSALTLGIYLIHPLMLGFAHRVGNLDGPVSVIAAYLASAAAAYAIRTYGGRFGAMVT